jgi:hypothetical protein
MNVEAFGVNLSGVHCSADPGGSSVDSNEIFED